MGTLVIVSLLLPVLGGLTLFVVNPKERAKRQLLVLAFVVPTTVLALYLCFKGVGCEAQLFRLTKEIVFAFRVDGLGRVFAALVSVLWPFASIYAFEYMSHEHRENSFFMWYTITLGVTLGICFAANLITLYMFYELLTLITLPLITHERDHKARRAGIVYIVYSIAGATASFVGIMIFTSRGGSFDFSLGGTWSGELEPGFFAAFLLMFFGFGVKAAVFPFYSWLPTAGVAPTPVTALLHAVAVVKAGVFAIIRVSYYCFGADNLMGSYVQKIALSFAAFTIVFGSAMAFREQHLKRRFAYSTISNLSYIVLGAMLFTPQGLTGGLLHMIFHGFMKITAFFVAGIINIKTKRYYVSEIEGFAVRMPKTFALYTVASLALVGVPPLCGFVSKYWIGSAAAEVGGVYAYLGVAALLISAVFTAVYMLSIAVHAYFPGKGFKVESLGPEVKDPDGYMLLPLLFFVVFIIVFGIYPDPIVEFVSIF